MKANRIILLIAIISCLALVALNQKRWDFRPYRYMSYNHLNTIYLDKIQETIKNMDEYSELEDEFLKNNKLPEPKVDRFTYLNKELKKQRKELKLIKLELILKKYKVTQILVGVAGATSLYLIITGAVLVINRYKNRKTLRKKVKGKIIVDPPSEIYISPGDLKRKIETGFLTRKDAEDWLRYNPSFWCSYCGGMLKGEYLGRVQKITFLRKPPEGATDLKIQLGEMWYAYPVSKAKCTKCGRIVEF